MRHFKLWVILTIVLVILVIVVVFGRGWVWFGTRWEPGGEFNWGLHVDDFQFHKDMNKLMEAVGLKDSGTPPAKKQ